MNGAKLSGDDAKIRHEFVIFITWTVIGLGLGTAWLFIIGLAEHDSMPRPAATVIALLTATPAATFAILAWRAGKRVQAIVAEKRSKVIPWEGLSLYRWVRRAMLTASFVSGSVGIIIGPSDFDAFAANWRDVHGGALFIVLMTDALALWIVGSYIADVWLPNPVTVKGNSARAKSADSVPQQAFNDGTGEDDGDPMTMFRQLHKRLDNIDTNLQSIRRSSFASTLSNLAFFLAGAVLSMMGTNLIG